MKGKIADSITIKVGQGIMTIPREVEGIKLQSEAKKNISRKKDGIAFSNKISLK